MLHTKSKCYRETRANQTVNCEYGIEINWFDKLILNYYVHFMFNCIGSINNQYDITKH